MKLKKQTLQRLNKFFKYFPIGDTIIDVSSLDDDSKMRIMMDIIIQDFTDRLHKENKLIVKKSKARSKSKRKITKKS